MSNIEKIDLVGDKKPNTHRNYSRHLKQVLSLVLVLGVVILCLAGGQDSATAKKKKKKPPKPPPISACVKLGDATAGLINNVVQSSYWPVYNGCGRVVRVKVVNQLGQSSDCNSIPPGYAVFALTTHGSLRGGVVGC